MSSQIDQIFDGILTAAYLLFISFICNFAYKAGKHLASDLKLGSLNALFFGLISSIFLAALAAGPNIEHDGSGDFLYYSGEVTNIIDDVAPYKSATLVFLILFVPFCLGVHQSHIFFFGSDFRYSREIQDDVEDKKEASMKSELDAKNKLSSAQRLAISTIIVFFLLTMGLLFFGGIQ